MNSTVVLPVQLHKSKISLWILMLIQDLHIKSQLLLVFSRHLLGFAFVFFYTLQLGPALLKKCLIVKGTYLFPGVGYVR